MKENSKESIKEYLEQGRILQSRMDCHKEKIERLNTYALSLSTQIRGDKVQVSKKPEALFASKVEKIMSKKDDLIGKLALCVNLLDQIQTVIDSVENPHEREVLRYYYIEGYSWEDIGKLCDRDSRTVRRWRDKAISNLHMPENPIYIY